MTEHHEVGGREPAPHPGEPALGSTGVVDHANAQPGKVDLLDVGRAPVRDVLPIVVAEDHVHRCVRRELVEHVGGAHVTAVQHDVRMPEVLGDRGRARLPPARRMRVGQDNDVHAAIVPTLAPGPRRRVTVSSFSWYKWNMEPDELAVFRQRPEWSEAIGKLKALADSHGTEAEARARRYADVYANRRGSMVFDVVASRRRDYMGRVLPTVERWEADHPGGTLASLADQAPDAKTYGLRRAEPGTMRAIARNLLEFAGSVNANEDLACRKWAESVRGLEHAHRLDPIVGAVPGIGPALFAYMRIRCGADAIKPDARVRNALRGLGFTVAGRHSVIVVARAAAAEVGLNLLALDQLLWKQNN